MEAILAWARNQQGGREARLALCRWPEGEMIAAVQEKNSVTPASSAAHRHRENCAGPPPRRHAG